MKSLVNLFWNQAEHRLRMAWRMLIQQIGHLAFTTMAGVPMLVLAWVVAAMQGQPVDYFGITNSPLFLYGNAFMGMIATVPLVWLLGHFIDRRKFSSFGFHLKAGWWIDFGFGLFLGAFLMAVIFWTEHHLGWITVQGISSVSNGNFPLHFGLGLITFLCVGFYEELLFRGYQVKNLSEGLSFGQQRPRLGIVLAVLISSIGFGAAHLMNPEATLVSTANIALAGVFLGLGYFFTGELAIPIGLHITWNFFQGVVFGFPVSGMPMGARIVNIVQQGPDAWTGARFGPEAGYIGLLAIVLGSLLTLLYIRLRYGTLKLDRSLTRYVPRKMEAAAADIETQEMES